MLPNRPENGLDLLGAMVGAAADRAALHLAGPIRFARCDCVQVNRGFSSPDVDLETWPVAEDHRVIVVSVFATAAQDNGSRTMAASGRFTFTTLTHNREYAA